MKNDNFPYIFTLSKGDTKRLGLHYTIKTAIATLKTKTSTQQYTEIKLVTCDHIVYNS